MVYRTGKYTVCRERARERERERERECISVSARKFYRLGQ